RIAISLELDRPFCLGVPRTARSNRIRSQDFIRGEVIKGVLARRFAERNGIRDAATLSAELQNQLAFDDLRMTHAFAEPKSNPKQSSALNRAAVIPLSLATSDAGWIDMSKAAAEHWPSGLAFQVDWKPAQFDEVRKVGAVADRPRRILMVRTEMDRSTGTARDHQLFAQEWVCPEGYRWKGIIDLSAIDASQRPQIISRLAELLEPCLDSIGKTKARARLVEATLIETAKQPLNLTDGDEIRVMLLTEAALFKHGVERQSVPPSALELYRDYFGSLHPSIELVKVFARQYRAGGAYAHDRYGAKQDYSPTLLTAAGSVFRLRLTDSTAVAPLIEQWTNHGLPPAKRADGSAPTFLDTPYLGQHGYGECHIAVNDDDLWPTAKAGGVADE
ncbi:hypothetical protein OAS86_06860, partial [Gammaproteobacteria bacterium]|nr:hypothetical protein [Gammaproteobacteria bacterium]